MASDGTFSGDSSDSDRPDDELPEGQAGMEEDEGSGGSSSEGEDVMEAPEEYISDEDDSGTESLEGADSGADEGYESEDDMTEDERMVQKVMSASKKRQRFLLQQLLAGRTGVDMGHSEIATTPEEEEFKREIEDTFNMQVVDINRTTKGIKSGGIVRYGSLVVVGNNN